MKTNKLFIAMITTALGLSCCTNNKQTITYPEARKAETVDTYFGTEIHDPYSWMENDTTAEVAAWVKAENEITFAHLDKIPFRKQLNQRLTELINYEKIGAPSKKHGKYYFFKNDGLQNQSVLYTKDALDATPEVLLDPNTLSDDGTVALDKISFSNDGKYLAYTISRKGSDWKEIFVIDLETRQHIADHIVWAKFSGAQWLGNGFFYSAYDAPVEGKEFSNVNENHKIYYHRLGTPQAEDVLIYQNPEFPRRFYSCSVSDDEEVMFVYESGANNGNRLFFKNLKAGDNDFTLIASNDEYEQYFIEKIGDYLYFYTNDNAPKYKIMRANINNPSRENWEDVIPENENTLNGCEAIAGHFIVTYTEDASDHAYIYDYDGNRIQEVKLPTLGSVGFSGNKDDDEIFYSFSSYITPTSIYKYDIKSNESTLYLSPELKFNPEDYTVDQQFFASKDGTQIPVFLIHRKDIVKDGSNPVLLYGYGGFNISLTPSFSTSRIPFIENGGIYAVVNLRGGGEYGEEWHLAGTKMQKQNVFDDFIAAAEYMIAEQYTSVGNIAIMGGSNGGLLVGAVVNQRPDLYTVAIPQVGVMDMLKYHKFTIGWNWAPDYGTSEDSEEMFRYLLNYSPIHTIKNDGTPYPAILVTTADHDDRVVPAHSFKYAATLQAANTGNAPKLIRIETNAGHGAGKPISKQIEETSDIFAFIMYHLGMNYGNK